jgi:hypothetical protein
MAKAKKSKAKSTKAKADAASTAYTGAYKASTKAAKSTYNFADTSSFFKPEQFQQFFSSFSKGTKGYQPANVQQWLEQYAETSQKNIETLTACAQLAAERTKDLLEDQASFFSKFFQETASTVQSTLTSNADPKDKFEEIAEYTKYYFDKTASAAKKAAEANAETAQKISDKLKKRATDAVEELSSAA